MLPPSPLFRWQGNFQARQTTRRKNKARADEEYAAAVFRLAERKAPAVHLAGLAAHPAPGNGERHRSHPAARRGGAVGRFDSSLMPARWMAEIALPGPASKARTRTARGRNLNAAAQRRSGQGSGEGRE